MSKKPKTAKPVAPIAPPEQRLAGDRPAFDADIRPPMTHEERASMIVGLPMPALVALLDDAGFTGKLDVLRTAMQIGTFAFSREIERDHQAVHSVAAASAVMSFLKNAYLTECNIDPVLGLLAEDIEILEFGATDDLRQFFAEFGRHLLAESQACSERNFAGLDEITRKSLCSGWRLPDACSALMGKVLVGAFAFDDVALARDIVTHSPYVLNELMPADLLGGSSPLAVRTDNGQVFACPIFHALQFGRVDCMEAVRAVAPEEPPFAMRIRQVDSDKAPLPIGRDNNSVGEILNFIDCVGVLASKGAVIPTVPTVLSDEMRRTLALPNLKHEQIRALHDVAMMGMQGGGYRLFPYFAGLEANNAYAIDPTATVMQAILFGRPERVGVTGQVNWARVFTPDLENNPFEKGMVNATKTNKPQGYEQAMVNAITRACDEGFAAVAIKQHGKMNLGAQVGSGDYKDLPLFMAVPLAHFLVENFNQAVVALVKGGMDPSKPTLDKGSTTPQEDADKVSPSCAHTLRTFSTRRRALAALDELDAEPAPVKSPAP